MNHDATKYLDEVCSQIKAKQIRLPARAELAGHIQTLTDELRQSGLEEAEAVRQALARMGDPREIGRQISSSNSPLQNRIPFIAGVSLLVAVFILLALLMNSFSALLDVPTLLITILLTLAFVLMGGFSRLTRMSALTRGRAAALYAGGIISIIGLIDMLSNLGSPDIFGPALSVCVTGMLYGLLVSAVLTSVAHLLRPLEGEEIRKILGWDSFEP